MKNRSARSDPSVLDFDILRNIFTEDLSGKHTVFLNRENYYYNLGKKVTKQGVYGEIEKLSACGYAKKENVEGKFRFRITKRGKAKLGIEMPLTTQSGEMIFYKAAQVIDDRPVKLTFLGDGEFISNGVPLRRTAEEVEVILEKEGDNVSVKALNQNAYSKTSESKKRWNRRGERHMVELLVKTDGHVNVEAKNQAVAADLRNQPKSSFWHVMSEQDIFADRRLARRLYEAKYQVWKRYNISELVEEYKNKQQFDGDFERFCRSVFGNIFLKRF